MKIILADDHSIVRQGLRSLLENKVGVKVVGEAADGRSALELAEKLFPQVVIMDVAMPLLNGIEATSQLKKRLPEINVIILSMYKEYTYVLRALRAGVSGYIVKDAVFEELTLALEAVKKGEIFLSPAVSGALIGEHLSTSPAMGALARYENLSPREKEILQLMLEKKSRTQIAQILSVSPKTVDRHKENLKEKLDYETDGDLFDFASAVGAVDSYTNS